MVMLSKRSLIFLLLIAARVVAAQSQEPAFERVLTNEGPSNVTIYSVIQGKQGFLWLGTATGLVRYDGYTFKRYAHNPANSHSLSAADR